MTFKKQVPVRATFALICFLFGLIPANAQDAGVPIDIAQQSLTRALDQLSKQTGLTIHVDPAATQGKKGQRLKGVYTRREAIEKLLSGTGLGYELTADGGVAVRPLAGVTAAGLPAATELPKMTVRDTVESVDYSVNVDKARTQDDPQAYTIFDAKQIEESGAMTIGEFLNSRLTMNASTSLPSESIGAASSGVNSTSINLRGLGTNETLLLVDGRRMANVSLGNGFGAGAGSDGQPDLNGIPLAAVERIEVLPSSASAIYGGSALGGVINVILKRQFDGGEINYSYQRPFQGNAPTNSVSGVYGFNLNEGRTRVMLSGSISDSDPLTLGDRAALALRNRAIIVQSCAISCLYGGGYPYNGGSTPNIASADGSNLVLVNGTSLNSQVTFIPVGAAPGANLTSALIANAGKQNLSLAPTVGFYDSRSFLEPTMQTKSAQVTIRQDLTDRVEAFAEFANFDNATASIATPVYQFFVPAGAPNNPFSNANGVYVSSPNTLASKTTSDSVTNSVTAGLIFHLPRQWTAEIDYTWSQNHSHYVFEALDYNVLDSTTGPQATGAINLFVDTLKYPVNYTPYLGTEIETVPTTVNDVLFRTNGPIASLPWGEITLYAGLEHRYEGFGTDAYDYVYPIAADSQFNDSAGQSQSINNAYGETLIPLVTSKNAIPGIHELSLQFAGRWDQYRVYSKPGQSGVVTGATGGSDQIATSTYSSVNETIAVKYLPVRDVILRASYGTAFLPPTASQITPFTADGCEGGVPCQLITDPKTGKTYNVDVWGGGNQSLKPQTATSIEFGAVWEPTVWGLNGLRANVEYTRIVQSNYIETLSAEQYLTTPGLSSLVIRDPATGLVTRINTVPVNTNLYKTATIDYVLDYTMPTRLGTFDFHAAATQFLYDQRQLNFGQPAFEYAGYPNDGGDVKLKANATVAWRYHHWTAGWTTTYWGSYAQVESPGSPSAILYPGDYYYSGILTAQGSNRIPAQAYHQVFGSYTFDDQSGQSAVRRTVLSKFKIQFSILNLFNKFPPFDAGASPQQLFTSGLPGNLYGRTLRVDIKKAF